MARPKKLSTEEMLDVVNGYYESCGNPDRLKFSFLEEYAVSLGFDVKAYDFRRDPGVRARINELRDLSLLKSEGGAIAYKSLDVEALISRSRSLQSLKNELVELDETWRRIYERAVALSHKSEALTKDIRQKALECEQMGQEIDSQKSEISRLAGENREISKVNRYLKRTIRTYLYPAVANEILRSENVLEQTDTDVMPETMSALVDSETPSPFSLAIAKDREFLSREDALMRRMLSQLHGDGDA